MFPRIVAHLSMLFQHIDPRCEIHSSECVVCGSFHLKQKNAPRKPRGPLNFAHASLSEKSLLNAESDRKLIVIMDVEAEGMRSLSKEVKFHFNMNRFRLATSVYEEVDASSRLVFFIMRELHDDEKALVQKMVLASASSTVIGPASHNASIHIVVNNQTEAKNLLRTCIETHFRCSIDEVQSRGSVVNVDQLTKSTNIF
jgi:hypothetical protein